MSDHSNSFSYSNSQNTVYNHNYSTSKNNYYYQNSDSENNFSVDYSNNESTHYNDNSHSQNTHSEINSYSLNTHYDDYSNTENTDYNNISTEGDFDVINAWNQFHQTALAIVQDDTADRLTAAADEIDKRNKEAKRLRRKKRIVIERNREAGHLNLVADYFADSPVYTDGLFRLRYRMARPIFLRIVEGLTMDIENYDGSYFCENVDACGRNSHSSLQKCTAALRMLAYGAPGDMVDEYTRVAGSTAIDCLNNFVDGVCLVFGKEYLRRPNENDIARLFQIGEARGFPGMLGSIDCMHWEWKNCPTAWQGQFRRGDHGKPTIMLEDVASKDLWIWHAFFSVPGCNNDINVLNQSPLFAQKLQGRAPEVHYTVNGTNYHMGYYLADGIYPEWASFVKTISTPQGQKRSLFAQYQESCRKDVERAFGVLQARFNIIRGPAREWHGYTLKNIMLACIIMHNMIVEDERDTYAGDYPLSFDHPNPSTDDVHHGPADNVTQIMLQMTSEIRDREAHHQLKADLVEHIWQKFGHDAQHD